MDKTKWKSIMLPKQLSEQLETFSESQLAKNLGFTNKSQIAANAVREFLHNYSSYLTYLDYLGFEKKAIKIMDYKIGEIVELSFDTEEMILYCRNHKSDNCDHIRFLWLIPRFEEELKKFQKPGSILKPKIYEKEEMLENFGRIIRQSVYNKKRFEKVSNKKVIQIIKEILKDGEK